MNKYYAVRVGKKRGIYTSWMDCLKNIRGYKNAEFTAYESEKAYQTNSNKLTYVLWP